MLLLPPRRIESATETEEIEDACEGDEPRREGDQGIGNGMRMTVDHEENLDTEEKEDGRHDPPFFRHGIIEREPFPESRRTKPVFHRIRRRITHPVYHLAEKSVFR